MQQNLFGGHSSAKKNGGNTFSDQKTPNGHPNTFLYRAHINLNEMSSANQGEYQDPGYQNQNVSAFYNDEVEEKKIDSEQPLRITKQNGRDSSAFSRGKEIEMHNPIMQMMQMHQQEK